MIPGRMQLNLDAGRALLADARAAGIPVLVYVVPLRDDVETPYVEAEYAEFKRFMRELAREHGVAFANLESLVPAELWGSKDATNTHTSAAFQSFMFDDPVGACIAESFGGATIGAPVAGSVIKSLCFGGLELPTFQPHCGQTSKMSACLAAFAPCTVSLGVGEKP